MKVFLTPDDLKKGDLAETGWHPAEIVDYQEKPADTDGSTNCLFFFKILDGPSKGIQPRKLFNEKALGFGKNLWKTANLPYDPERGYELSTELFKSMIGLKMKIYNKRGKSSNGNEFNDISDFMPLA